MRGPGGYTQQREGESLGESVGATGFEASRENAPDAEDSAGSPTSPGGAGAEPPRPSPGSGGTSADPVVPNAEPLSIEVLRRKLDAAIDAEEWPAVSVIRERIRELETANVVSLADERARRAAR
jgi:hypothetical protein